MLYPTNEVEEAAEAALRSLADSAASSEEPSGIAGRLVSIFALWRRLDRNSPYRDHVLQRAQEVVDGYSAEGSRALDLIPEREMLVMLTAQHGVAAQLRGHRASAGLSIRAAASRASVSASYFSELETAHAGLPSEEVANRLDETLGTTLQDVVEQARREIGVLQSEAAKLALERRGTAASDTDPRIVAATSALRRDPSLVEIVELARRLDETKRRAVAALIRALAS